MPSSDQDRNPATNETEARAADPSEMQEPLAAEPENDRQKSDEAEPDDPEGRWKRVWVFNRKK